MVRLMPANDLPQLRITTSFSNAVLWRLLGLPRTIRERDGRDQGATNV